MALVIILLLELVSQSRQADLTYVMVARCCGPRSTGARNCRLSMASEGPLRHRRVRAPTTLRLAQYAVQIDQICDRFVRMCGAQGAAHIDIGGSLRRHY
jgi:hypothetical protein